MKRTPRNDLATTLRTARRGTDIAQEGFVGVSGRTYISQLERGERNATLSNVDKLASLIGPAPGYARHSVVHVVPWLHRRVGQVALGSP